jgi:hypothetical protein
VSALIAADQPRFAVAAGKTLIAFLGYSHALPFVTEMRRISQMFGQVSNNVYFFGKNGSLTL